MAAEGVLHIGLVWHLNGWQPCTCVVDSGRYCPVLCVWQVDTATPRPVLVRHPDTASGKAIQLGNL